MKVWRLLPDIAADGATQMAIDTALFEAHQLGLSPPTLRFYTWEKPTVSLGYHQRQVPEHWRSIALQTTSLQSQSSQSQHSAEVSPLDWVRRPTGGRAVLHRGDLTYAIVGSNFAASRTIAYEEICQFLIHGWAMLGYPLQYGVAARGYIHNPNCFGTATRADLVLPNGSKLIGSAQKRSGPVILQHGSMALNPDRDLWSILFQEPAPEIPIEIQSLPIDRIQTALTQAAIETFHLNSLEIQPLTSFEEDAIAAILAAPGTLDIQNVTQFKVQ